MYQRLSLKNKKLIKMNKRINGFFKITAVCLCIVMFIAAVPVGAFALPNYDAQEIFNAFKNFTIENIPDSLKSGLIDLNDAVRIEQPDGYDVNSLILDFGDGEKTLYQYDEPIKFTDEEGYVHFIDSSLKSTVKCKNLLEWYAFENTANSVKTYFPWYVSTGVLTEFDGYSFEIIPAADINSRAVRPESSDITVEYPNAFGKGTTLQYVSLNDGVKENIILNSYNGKTVYEYKIRANGLTPKLTPDGDISLVNENHDVVFTISKVIMFDSAEVPNHSDNNSYELTEQKNGMWTLRVLLDDNFLNDENTVYPVTVDPSATTGNSNTAFDNQTYYSDNTNEHYDLFSSIGISENSYEHVTYLRLNDMTPFVAINPAKITGATLTLYSNSSSPSYDIDAFAYNFNPDVDIDSLEWLDIIDVQQAPDFYTTATLSDKVTLNIKSLFIAWLTAETKYYSRTNTMYKKDGLFLRASFDSYSVSPYKPLYFENVNSSIKAPCLTVSYVEDVSLETGYYYIQSGYYYEDARYLTASSNGLAINDYTGDANQIWYVASNYDYAPAEDLYGDYRIYNVSSMGYTECGSGNSVHLSNYQSDSFLWNEDCSFKILDQSNGYKRIVNLNDGSPVTLEVRNYSKDNGAPIVTNTVKGLDNQRWKFKKIEKVAVPVGSTSQTMVVGQNPKIISYMLSMNVGSTSDVTVTSSNSDVVSVTEHTLYGTSVNDHGNITLSANAPGSAVITARAAVTNDFNQTVYYNTYWNITVEGQSISLSETSINLDVGDYYDLEATTNLIGLEITWSSSDENVAEVGIHSGRITAKRAGTAIITATTTGGSQASCEVTANQVLTGADLYIDDIETRSLIIKYKTMYDYIQISYLNGAINNCQKNEQQKSIEKAIDFARADYIILNPQSNFAYQFFQGRNYVNSDICPFTRESYTYPNSGYNNPEDVVAIMIIQRTLELLGYFEPPNEYEYGTYDQETHDALLSSNFYVSGSNDFQKYSYYDMLGSTTSSERTKANVKLLHKMRLFHNEVADWVALKVAPDSRTHNTTIYKNPDHSKWGFADVMKTTDSNEYIWEVEPWGQRYRALNGMASEQLRCYIDSWNNNEIDQKYSPRRFALPGYNIGKFAFRSNLTNQIIVVESNSAIAPDIRSGLVHYYPTNDDEYRSEYASEYALETEAVPVTVPTYNYSFGESISLGNIQIIGMGEVWEQTVLIVLIAGTLCCISPYLLAAFI